MRTKPNRKRINPNNTRKSRSLTNPLNEQHIMMTFLEMLNTVKIYHWKTHVYSQHKATDSLYDELNSNIDSFIETMLGKTGSRVNLTKYKTLVLNDYNSVTDFKKKIEQYKTFLIQMSNGSNENNSDLLNIRDNILGNLNQFEYLLTFH
jgi:DNA-binding ferritin-like protein